MRTISKTIWATIGLVAAAQAHAEVTLYQDPGFQGRSFSAQERVDNLNRFGFQDRASSATVRDERWEVCEDARFGGRCKVLRPGQYANLSAMGLNNRISSARAVDFDQRVDQRRYAPAPSSAKITFYGKQGLEGRSFTTEVEVEDFRSKGFNDRVSSLVVQGTDQWEACDDSYFAGRCVTLPPGRYDTLRGTGLNNRISSVRNISSQVPAPPAAQIALFAQEGFEGRAFTAQSSLQNLTQNGLYDRASSAVVVGDQNWEVCDDARFNGRCMVLRPGQYPSLAAMGMNNRVSSVRELDPQRRIDPQRYAPLAMATPDYRKRREERLFEAEVRSVRAVVGPPEQRCWIEREQAAQETSEVNAPGAVLGALLGGVLGHQVGGGSGKDIATAGAAIAGAVLGSKVGNNVNQQGAPARDVQRCEDVPSQARPEYWDVVYSFRGEEHRIQMTAPPGRTITVNAKGEPRT